MTHRPYARMLVLLLLGVCPLYAQTPTLTPPAESQALVPLRIQVVLARYRGDQRISSLPYTLSVNAQNPGRSVAQLRMGADIPVAAGPSTSGDGKISATVNYDQVGTQIDCVVRPVGNDRYALELSVSDKSVYGEGEEPKLTSASRTPTFRSFRSTNSVMLRDGQTVQFVAATDRMTGEVVRVEVTLHVVK